MPASMRGSYKTPLMQRRKHSKIFARVYCKCKQKDQGKSILMMRNLNVGKNLAAQLLTLQGLCLQLSIDLLLNKILM